MTTTQPDSMTKDEGPFHVSRTSDGERDWFSARDAASGVSIPAKDRDDAYAMVAAINGACSLWSRRPIPSSADNALREALERLHRNFHRLAMAAGALTIATDDMPNLRKEREEVLAALKAVAALSQLEASNGKGEG